MSSPATFPWWEWLLAAFVAFVICYFARSESQLKEDYGSASLVTFLSGSLTLLFGWIGLIRFVKWFWTW